MAPRRRQGPWAERPAGRPAFIDPFRQPIDARRPGRPRPAILAGSLPSEAGLEVNILRYLAACIEERRRLPEGGVTITLPTQHEEHSLGFDAATYLSPGRYAVLQSKRPRRPKGGAASFKLQADQFCTLLRYPPASAFYVLPVVETNRDMWDARAGLLDRACLVDARDLIGPFLSGVPGPQRRGNPFGEGTRTVQVDGYDPCTASVMIEYLDAGTGTTRNRNRRRRRICAKSVRALCAPPPWAGSVVAGGGGEIAAAGAAARRIMTASGRSWSREEASRLLAQDLGGMQLPPLPERGMLRGRPDDGADRAGWWAERIVEYVEHASSGRSRGRGRGSRHLLGFGGAP